MTTRKFSTIKLPYPKYSLNVGKFNLTNLEQQKQQLLERCQNNDNLDREHTSFLPSTCLPRITHLTQLVEVKKAGHASLEDTESRLKKSLGSYLLIENARPELFIRRDFIAKFVDKGVIHLSHVHGDDQHPGYRLSTRDNILIITMNAKQYHRFGLVAKKVKRRYGKDRVSYKVEIDLKNELIKTSNKYQDKLMLVLKRLNSINKIYFRFDPSKSTDISVAAANELSADYFNYVINEYAQDGCQPVPLTGCRKICQTIQKSWLNCSQLHPRLNLDYNDNVGTSGRSLLDDLARNNVDNLASIVDIIDWLGYQLLSLDCGRNEIHSSYLTSDDNDSNYHNNNDGDNDNNNKVDVACLQVSGIIDYQYAQEELIWNLFHPNNNNNHNDQSLILRALFLYSNIDNCNNNDSINQSNPINDIIEANDLINYDNSGIVYLQDCSRGSKAANEITVIGMSALADY